MSMCNSNLFSFSPKKFYYSWHGAQMNGSSIMEKFKPHFNTIEM